MYHYNQIQQTKFLFINLWNKQWTDYSARTSRYYAQAATLKNTLHSSRKFYKFLIDKHLNRWRVVTHSSPLIPPVFIGVSGKMVKSEEWNREWDFYKQNSPYAAESHRANHQDSPVEIFLPTYRFLPGNGTILPFTGAILCHYQAKRETRHFLTCNNNQWACLRNRKRQSFS